MMVSAAMTDAFGAQTPTTEAGLVRDAGQTGIFIYAKVDYTLYLKDAGGTWNEYADITADKESLTVPWGANTAAFFKCADGAAKLHVHAKTGSILYDSTPEDNTDANNTLLASGAALATEAVPYTFPAADGADGQVLVTDGAGNLSFADQSGGGSHAASNFTFDASLIPDTNAAYDLGSAEYKVRHLFLSDNSIKFESGDLSVDGGNLTWNGSALGGGGSSDPEVTLIKMSSDFVCTFVDVNERITLPFDTVVNNSFGSAVFDTATNKFTAAETGFYYINCQVYQTGVDADETSQYQVRFESTNSETDTGGIAFRNYFPGDGPASSVYAHRLDRIIHLTAGDEVWISLRNLGNPESDSVINALYSLTNLAFYKLK